MICPLDLWSLARVRTPSFNSLLFCSAMNLSRHVRLHETEEYPEIFFHCYIINMLPRERLWVVEHVRTQVLIQGADGQRLQEWMADDVDIALSERSPCFDLNAQRVVVGDIFFLRHQRVYLYLVDGGADVGVCQQVVESLVIVQI